MGLATVAPGQELSTSVFPSEDELYESYNLGEISYEQYLILKELAGRKIDSTNCHLLDEIPNLSFFQDYKLTSDNYLEKEQTALFVVRDLRDSRITGKVGYKYYQELEKEGRDKYQSSMKFKINRQYDFSLKLRREYSGTERIVERSFGYKKGLGGLRELRVGNYSCRMGLGTIFGYRGKIFDFADEIDEESWLFPDYGGYNGLYARFRQGLFQSEILTSVVRDRDYSMVSTGGMLTLLKRNFRAGIIYGNNHLKRRTDNYDIDDFKYGLYLRHKYRGGNTGIELSGQAGENNSFGAVVWEGVNKFERFEVRYAWWVYDDSYLDLTGGSKAGNLYRSLIIPGIDFTYSDKRAGQEGGLLKMLVTVSDKSRWINSLSLYALDNDNTEIQFMTGWQYAINEELSIRADYLNKSRKRNLPGNVYDKTAQQWRFETRLSSGLFSVRDYIAYETETNKNDYLLAMVHIKYDTRNVGQWEFWTKMARINPGEWHINYWYFYLRFVHRLKNGVETAMKISHRYNIDENEKNLTTAMLELSLSI